MKRLQIATLVMTAAAALIAAVLAIWTYGPATASALADQVGELAVSYNNAQLARDFERIYPHYRSRLPVRIDDRTTLVDLSWRGHVFRLRHLVEPESGRTAPAAIGERHRKAALTKVCADADMRATLTRGAIYEYRYLDRQSRLVGSFDIRDADCDS